MSRYKDVLRHLEAIEAAKQKQTDGAYSVSSE